MPCKKFPEYMFISNDGFLYDTRENSWHRGKPLRKLPYQKTYREITTTSQLKATLRAGECAWPGGYPMFFVTSDGAALHFNCVKENFHSVIDSIKNKIDDGWSVARTEVNYECLHLYCAHCNKLIESAYGENEDE